MKLRNIYYILRHGEAKSNKERFVSSWPEKIKTPLTDKGKKQIQNIIPKLKKEKIDLIFSSDLLRTKQTAEMIAKQLKLKVNFDKRLREIKFGVFNGKSEEEWLDFLVRTNRFKEKPSKGENWLDIRKRTESFIKNTEKIYRDKRILIIGHQDPLLLFEAIIKNLSNKKILKNRNKLRVKQGEFKKLT